jgi:hypothetical protein
MRDIALRTSPRATGIAGEMHSRASVVSRARVKRRSFMMRIHLRPAPCGAAITLAALVSAPLAALEPLPLLFGRAPTYTQRALSAVPNEAAVRQRLWVPGLDEGYVPQGVTVAEHDLLVATYHSTDPGQDKGACRVFRVDPATGNATGSFALPSDCGHAGGIEYAGNGLLYVADTRTLYAIDLPRALADGDLRQALRARIKLTGRVRGSFLGYGNGRLMLGTYSRDPAQLYVFDAERVAALADGASLGEDASAAVLPIAAGSQGAAVDARGALWITQSGGKYGRLQRLDPQTGAVGASWEMPAGIEDISFARDGTLWAVAEAGSQRWLQWDTFYPIVFALDPQRLK